MKLYTLFDGKLCASEAQAEFAMSCDVLVPI